MPMTVVVTRSQPGRVRGFLASCMCEIAPGVYTAPRMSAGVRERVWEVLTKWFEPGPDRAIVMTWPDPSLPGGQAVEVLGVARVDLCNWNGIYLARRDLTEEELCTLTTQQEKVQSGERDVTVSSEPNAKAAS